VCDGDIRYRERGESESARESERERERYREQDPSPHGQAHFEFEELALASGGGDLLDGELAEMADTKMMLERNGGIELCYIGACDCHLQNNLSLLVAWA